MRCHLAGSGGDERRGARCADGFGPGFPCCEGEPAYLIGALRDHPHLGADHSGGDPHAAACPAHHPGRTGRAIGGGARSIRSGSLAGHSATERLTTQRPALADADVDRFWLRGTAALMGAMGAALLAVASATYAMAIGHNAYSWTGYGIAGAITLVMPLIPWRHVRQLRGMLAA